VLSFQPSREIARHGGRSAYRAHDADQQAWDSALRPKRCLLAMNRKLRDIVASKLMLDWSPEQISGWLKHHYPNNESMRVSHETIYRSLFIQARGVLKKELSRTLPRTRQTFAERWPNRVRGQRILGTTNRNYFALACNAWRVATRVLVSDSFGSFLMIGLMAQPSLDGTSRVNEIARHSTYTPASRSWNRQ